MNQIRLLIVDRDIEYATVLGKTLANKYPVFQIEVINENNININDLFLRNKEQYDLVLVDADLKLQMENLGKDVSNIIGLCREVNALSEKKGYLYKYEGVVEISSELQVLFAQLTGRAQLNCNKLNTELIGFTGACGGVGITSVAIAAGRELLSYDNSKVLYLSLEEIESTEIYLSGCGGKGTISDYLYYLFSKREKHIATYPDYFLFRDEYGLEAFRPSKGTNELKGLSWEKLSYFLEAICNNRNYRYICLDFKGDISTQTFYLMKACKKVLFVDDGKPLSIYKNQRLLNCLHFLYGENFEEKILQVRNKWTGGTDLPGDFFLDYDKECFHIGEKCIEINNNTGFGMGVKKIADELREKI
ncbi:MAG: hypothetical protein ACOX4P_05620 [Anaerovoracaceae bacterium]|jgi:MinD-like ATPase involved in chromosome partitioning or flagellar assembly